MGFAHDLIAEPTIDHPDDRPRTYVYGQGGGWLGRFSLPIWIHLMRELQAEADDGVLHLGGCSVSALHATLASQGELDKAEDLWAGINDGFALDGIKGFTRLSLKQGIWSMKPLQKKIAQLAHNRGPIPCRVGVVLREPFRHHSLANTDARNAKQWQEWVAASAAIAFVFRPVPIKIGGKTYSGRDGGHLFSVPWIPYRLRAGDTVHMLLHNPLDANVSDVPKLGSNKLLGELKWTTWAHTKTGHWEALRRAERLAAEGVHVKLWAPPEPLGEMLDGDKATLDHRDRLGRDVVKRGPVSAT